MTKPKVKIIKKTEEKRVFFSVEEDEYTVGKIKLELTIRRTTTTGFFGGNDDEIIGVKIKDMKIINKAGDVLETELTEEE